MTTTAPAEISAHTRRIYTLHGYPPEVIAVAFAKTSRVPDSFDAIAADHPQTDGNRRPAMPCCSRRFWSTQQKKPGLR